MTGIGWACGALARCVVLHILCDQVLSLPFSPVVLRGASLFLDSVVSFRGVLSVALWSRAADGQVHPLGCRPDRSAPSSEVRLEPAVQEWLDAATGVVWRVHDHPVLPSFGPSDGIHLVLAVDGVYLAQLRVGDFAELGAEGVHRIAQALRDVVRVEAGEPSVDSDAYEHIDESLIESIALGDMAFMVELLTIAEQQLGDGWGDVVRAFEQGALDRAAQLAHRLRSTARTLGATRLDDDLFALEQAARVGEPGAVDRALARTSDAVALAAAEVRRLNRAVG